MGNDCPGGPPDPQWILEEEVYSPLHRLSATLGTGAHTRLYLGSQVHALDPGQVWEASWDEPLLIRELHAAA